MCAAESVLLAVERDDFIEAVVGHPRCLSIANDVVIRHLAVDAGDAA